MPHLLMHCSVTEMSSNSSFRALCGPNLSIYNFTSLLRKDKIIGPQCWHFILTCTRAHIRAVQLTLSLSGWPRMPPAFSSLYLCYCSRHSSLACIQRLSSKAPRPPTCHPRKQGNWASTLSSSQDLNGIQAVFNSSMYFPTLYLPCGVNLRAQRTQIFVKGYPKALFPALIIEDSLPMDCSS